jgi:hypothetical protein
MKRIPQFENPCLKLSANEDGGPDTEDGKAAVIGLPSSVIGQCNMVISRGALRSLVCSQWSVVFFLN